MPTKKPSQPKKQKQSNIVIGTTDRINLSNIQEVAKYAPEHTNLLIGIHMIDVKIKDFVKDILIDLNLDLNNYYIKTEMMNQLYLLYLWKKDMNATVGMSWMIAELLDKCSDKTIEMDINIKVRKAVLRFDEKRLKTGDKINWIGETI